MDNSSEEIQNQSNSISRRKFIFSLSLATGAILTSIPFVNSCNDNSTDSNDEIQPDILLKGSEEEVASAIQKQYGTLNYLAENIGKKKTIGFSDNNELRILTFSFQKNDLASYPYLQITDNKTNRNVNILWGMEGIYPSIKFADNSGETLVINNTEMEFALNPSLYSLEVNSPTDWLLLGIQIFALALIIWLGASISKYIISAISFLAFNALVLGLLFASLSIIIPLIKTILGITNWNLDTIRNLFDKAIEELLLILLNIRNFILNR